LILLFSPKNIFGFVLKKKQKSRLRVSRSCQPPRYLLTARVTSFDRCNHESTTLFDLSQCSLPFQGGPCMLVQHGLTKQNAFLLFIYFSSLSFSDYVLTKQKIILALQIIFSFDSISFIFFYLQLFYLH